MFARVLLVMLAAIVWLSPAALAEKRVALVIGNNSYANLTPAQQLKKAINDARSMAATLKELGFETQLGLDLGRSEINRKLQELANKVQPGDTVALFFAGHGVRIDGQNYLLPSDVPKVQSGQDAFLKSESVRVDTITDTLNARGARITLLILDACRDNPFQDSKGRSVGGTRGLARMEPAQGTFIMFSAGAGQQALDRLSDADPNPNSIFTRTLIPLMREPGLEIGTMAKRVKRDVNKLALSGAGHQQTPAVYNEMLNDFYLAGGKGKASDTQPSAKIAATPPVTTTRSSQDQAEFLFWQSVTAKPTRDSYEAYLQSYPSGKFATLAQARIAALDKAAQSPPEPPAATEPMDSQSDPVGFIFPESHLRRIRIPELVGLSRRKLRIARNEIYARKGRYFKSKDLKIYFRQFPWYQPYTWKPRLNQIEKLNVRVIQAAERRK